MGLLIGATRPHSFAPATTLRSQQVNANFAALKAAVDALESPTRRGTVLCFGRVPDEDAAPFFAPGAYTCTGAPRAAIMPSTAPVR